MGEPKPIASLSGVLLARKGAARPAMRRPTMQDLNGAAGMTQDDLGWNDMGYDVDPDPTTPMDYDHNPGYNPLAAAVPEPKPEVRIQQERIAAQLQDDVDEQIANEQAAEEAVEAVREQIVAPVAVVAPAPVYAAPAVRVAKPRAAAGSKEKAAFTLRLNSDRHLKLRLACAVSNRSAQMLVTEALDAWLESMPEIAALAANVPSKSSN